MKTKAILGLVMLLSYQATAQSATSTPKPIESITTKKASEENFATKTTIDPYTKIIDGELTLLSSPNISISNFSSNSVPRLSVNGFNQERLIIYLDNVLLAQNATGGYDVDYLLSLKLESIKILNGSNGFVEIWLTREKSATPFSVSVGNVSLAPSTTIKSMFAEQNVAIEGTVKQSDKFNFSYDVKGDFGTNYFSQGDKTYNAPNLAISPNFSFFGKSDELDYNVTLRSSYKNFKTTDDLGYGGYEPISGSEKEQATVDSSLNLSNMKFGLDNAVASFNMGYSMFFYKDYGVKSPDNSDYNNNTSHQIYTNFKQEFTVNDQNNLGYKLAYQGGFYENNGYNYNDGYSLPVDAFDGQLHRATASLNHSYKNNDFTLDTIGNINFSNLNNSIATVSGNITASYNYEKASPTISAFTNINYPTLATLYYVSPYYNYNDNIGAERYSGGRLALNSKIGIWQNTISLELGAITNAIYANTDSTTWITTYENSPNAILNTITSVSGTIGLPKNWSITYGYTFTYAMDSVKNYNQFYNYISPHVALLGFNYRSNEYELGFGFRYASAIYSNIGDEIMSNIFTPTIHFKIMPSKHFYVKLDCDMVLPENATVDAYNPSPKFKAELKLGYVM